MNPLLTILSVFTTALKRLRANVGLALCALAALLVAVALAVSIPVYAEGASLRLLREEIAQVERRDGRSPFALLFRYVGAWNGPLEWDRVSQADELISGAGIRSLGLPLDSFARHARTDQLRLFVPPSASGGQNQFLKNVTLGFIGGLDPQMRIVDGARPEPQLGAPSATAPIHVLVARPLADEVGINVGDRFTLVGAGSRPVSLPIEVAGLWEAVNAADPAWFFQPSALTDVILVAEETYTGPVAEALRGEVGQVLWYARLSGQGLTAAEAAPLLTRVEAIRAQAAGAVPGLRLEQSPAEALGRYRESARQLTVQLLVFSVPILGLVLYFVGLVASLLVNRQRGEIALLKTRGVRDAQILGVYVVEWGLLGALALAAGPQLGLLFATFMGRTTSFLQLAGPEAAPETALALTPGALAYGVAAVLLALTAALLPAFGATRRTLVDEQQQAARTLRPPFWQRYYLDLLLLVPPAYGIYQLQRSGGLFLGGAGVAGTDPFANPLLMLVPVLLCFGLGLLAVRLVPLALELLARLAAAPGWTVPLIVLRNLARQPGAYRGPLLLLILTLSLAAFSASMAATIDGALRTAVAYQVGADTQLLETGQSTEQQSGQGQGDQPRPPERVDIQEEPRFLFYPVTDHLEVPGIEAAARVGTYDATLQVGGANRNARVVGIDRVDFPNVVGRFERAWGGGESLGALMNLLARNSDGVLVSRDVLARGLTIGDRLPVLMRMYGDQREVQFRIIGAIDLWPGYYPQDGPIVVANLNYVFDQMSGQYPYDVWIKRDPQANLEEVVSGVRRLGITVVDAVDAAELTAREQARPSRQGLFGLLSVGFVAAGGLTLLGFLLAGLITARRRAIELGVLQALGMSGPQVGLALTLEQLILVAAGIGAGTGIGVLAARLVVPLLQVGAGPHPGTPAYAPQLAWEQVAIIYAVFAAALLLTLIALGVGLSRMRLFQAVKLGDAN
jgi:putative ABC transport system permease protein